MSALGISIREFARREACSDKYVRTAIKSGHLKPLEDGTLAPGLVGSGWCERNRKAADKPADTKSAPVRTAPPKAKAAADTAPTLPPLGDDETPEAFAQRIIAGGIVPHSLAEAERIKENYLALLRQLEYDQKAGQVVMVAEVAKAVGTEYARVRTRMLAIPSEKAPMLHRLKTVPEVEDALREIITEALEELTRDGPDSA